MALIQTRGGITDAQIRTQRDKRNAPPAVPYQQQLDTHTKQLERMTEFLLLGFAVLLVMVGTLVWTAFTDWKHSGEDTIKQLHNDQYQFQQQEINFLINMSTKSAVKSP